MLKIGDIIEVIKTFDQKRLPIGSTGTIMLIKTDYYVDFINTFDIIIPMKRNEIIKVN